MERTVLGLRIVPLSIFLIALSASAVASAQCAEGRVANDQTQGRCCWPGQSWSPETALCTGAPTCPAGRVAQGDDCVLQAGVGAAPGASNVQVQGQVTTQGQAQGTGQIQQTDQNAVPQAPAGYGQQPVQQGYGQQQPGYGYQVMPAQQPQMRTVTRMRTGLMITGFIMFGVSYAVAAAAAVDAEYGWLAIPFAGPLILMGELGPGDSALAYLGLTLWSLVQTGGLVLAILGITMKREVQVRADLGNGRSIAVAPWGNQAGGGLQLLGEF